MKLTLSAIGSETKLKSESANNANSRNPPKLNQVKRGRILAVMPTAKQLEILRATKLQTYEQVAVRFNMSKQRVGAIVRRWKKYLPIRRLLSRKLVEMKSEEQRLKKKERRIHIISFRLTETEVGQLRLRYPDKKSVDRAAREIVSKFLTI
jgi:aspartate carbamoyltransferase regulatory subunit